MLSFRRPSLAILLLTAVLVLPAAAQQIPLDALMRGGRIHYEGQRYDRAKEQFNKAADRMVDHFACPRQGARESGHEGNL